MHTDTVHPFHEDTLFIIVIYNCIITESAAFQSLCGTTSSQNSKDIFIYDNSKSSQAVASLNQTVYYIHNPHNAGVSEAYNKGFDKAKELNKKWLLLLDQDTRFDERALEKYAQNIVRYPDVPVFAPLVKSNHRLLSPFRLLGGKGIRIRSRQPGIHFFRPLYVINSGLLISATLFEMARGYDERFPLDFSDVVFVNRLSMVDNRFVVVDTTLTHSLSADGDWYNTPNNVLDRFEKFCTAAKLLKKQAMKL